MSGPILLVLRIVFILALYAFLGMALYLIWRDLRRQVHLLAAPQIPSISLIGSEEQHLPVYRFNRAEVMLGRDPACDLHLEDQTISARHARLSFHHGQWWVEDMRSTNGTFVNGEAVTEPLVLATGDQLRCGSLFYRISLDDNLKTSVDRSSAEEMIEPAP